MFRKIQATVVSLVSLTAMIFMTSAAFSQTAEVKEMTGTVESRAGAGAWQPVKKGDKLAEGATVRTKAASSAVLSWGAGHAAKVNALSTVTLEQLTKPGSDKTLLKVDQGKIVAHARKLQSAESSFALKTPTAVAGVRGTDEFCSVGGGGESTFGFSGGDGYMEAGGEEIEVPEGNMIEIDETGAFTEPEPMPVEMKQEVEAASAEIKAAVPEVAAAQAKESAAEGKQGAVENKAAAAEKKEEAQEKQESKQESSGGGEQQASGGGEESSETEAGGDDTDIASDATNDAVNDTFQNEQAETVEQLITGTVEVFVEIPVEAAQ